MSRPVIRLIAHPHPARRRWEIERRVYECRCGFRFKRLALAGDAAVTCHRCWRTESMARIEAGRAIT